MRLQAAATGRRSLDAAGDRFARHGLARMGLLSRLLRRAIDRNEPGHRADRRLSRRGDAGDASAPARRAGALPAGGRAAPALADIEERHAGLAARAHPRARRRHPAGGAGPARGPQPVGARGGGAPGGAAEAPPADRARDALGPRGARPPPGSSRASTTRTAKHSPATTTSSSAPTRSPRLNRPETSSRGGLGGLVV